MLLRRERQATPRTKGATTVAVPSSLIPPFPLNETRFVGIIRRRGREPHAHAGTVIGIRRQEVARAHVNSNWNRPQSPGTLSIFQRLMLLWNRLHPYNAVHVVRVAGSLDLPRLESVVNDRLETLGVTGLEMDLSQRRANFCGGPADIRVELLETGGNARAAVQAEMGRQINTPFPLERRCTPFRVFAAPDKDGFYLGLGYCHFVSDADPIVHLLADLATSYCGDRLEAFAPARRVYGRMLRVMFRHLPAWMCALPPLVMRLQHAAKPRYLDRLDHTNGMTLQTVGRDEFAALRDTAQSWSVTLNDVFLASLLKAVAPLAVDRFLPGRREHLAVSSIATSRRELCPGPPSGLGLFLGSFMVSHPDTANTSLRDVALDIHRQTERIKRHRLYVRLPLWVRLAVIIIPRHTRVQQQKLFRKHYPLWGGTTNMNLNRMFARPVTAPVQDYLRSVSTGPACPLVMSLTTFRDVLNIGASYRTTVFPHAEAAQAIAGFSTCLTDPTGS